jgi:reverse gyrase
MKVWSKACPRCRGDIRFEDDSLWERLVCVQCGWQRDMGASARPNQVGEETWNLMQKHGKRGGRHNKGSRERADSS